MAISEVRSSSDATPTLEDQYDVFLNFRGEDISRNFTEFLHDSLVDAGVHVFRDEEKLPVDEEIGHNLLRVINNCRLYIPIFSQTYASSNWCLRELALMVDNVSNSRGHKSILPIFFDVEPKDLNLKTPLYKAFFLEHEKKFPDKVEVWKKALAEVDETKGWNVKTNHREGIEVFTKRCLMKILDIDKFRMQDQLIVLRRQIVRENSIGDSGKQSRLWITKEAFQIISIKERKDKVQALQIFGVGDCIKITNEEFERLPNLRFLDLFHGNPAGDFARCRSNLRCLCWQSPFNDDFMVDNMYLDRLVVCKLHFIHFEDNSKAWDLVKNARNLKVLSFARCSGITALLDISKCSGLERLTLVGCSRLKRIESFIGNLQSLIELRIEECRDLIDLPKEIGTLVKLRHFSLSGCGKLRELGGSMENLTSLVELDLTDTIIRELPNSIGKLSSLRILRFPLNYGREDYDWELPSGINMLVNLEELDLCKREVTGEIPIEIGEMSSLRILNLKGTNICKIPRTIKMLHDLQTLNLWNCNAIQELPELPTNLICLHLESESLLSIPNLSNLTSLVELQLSNDSRDKKKSKSLIGCNLRGIGRLSRLKKLELNLLDVPTPLELASLSHLEDLVLRNLDSRPLVQLPSPYWSLKNLSTLEIGCCEVEEIPLRGLPQLEKLIVDGCVQLQRLSIPLELRKLQQVGVSKCPELIEINVAGLSKSLKQLGIDECKSFTTISGLSYLKNLEKLRIEDCNVLTNVEGLNRLESLKSLEVRSCMSLRWWINASSTKIPSDSIINIRWCGDSIKDSRFPSGSPAPPKLASLSHLEELTLSDLDPESLVQLPSFNWSWRNLLTLEFYWCEVEDIPLGGLQQLEILTVDGCKRLQRLSIPSKLRKLQKVRMSKCPELVEIQVVGLSKSLEYLRIYECKSLTRVNGLSYLKNLETLRIEGCNVLTNVEGLNELESLKFLDVERCISLRWLIDASCTSISNDCAINIKWCGDSIKDSRWRLSLKQYKEEILLNTSNKDAAEFHISGPNKYSDYASVGENEIEGTSSIDDIQSEPGNSECFEATRNRRQSRDRRTRLYGSVDGGKMANIENRKRDKDEIRESSNQNNVVRSSCQRCKVVEHYEGSYIATTEVEDQRDLSSVKRDRTVETDRLPAKMGRGSARGCSSNPGRDPTKRGKGRGTATSSRNGKGLRLGRDAASTLGKGTTSNSGKDIASSLQSSIASSSGRARGSTSSRGTTFNSGRGTGLSFGLGRGSSSRMDTTKRGTTSSPGRGITSCSQSSTTLSTGRVEVQFQERAQL